MSDISRPAALALLACSALLQATAVWHFPVFGIVWMPVLQVTALLALWHGPAGGAAWGFVAGLMLDVFSGAPWGTSALAMTLAGFLGGFAAEVVLPNRLVLAISSTFWVSVTYSLFLTVMLLTLGYSFPVSHVTLQVLLPTAVANALLAPIVFAFGSRVLEMTSGRIPAR